MKKNIPYIIIIILCVFITVASTVVACTKSQAIIQTPSQTSSSKFETESDTLTIPNHKLPNEVKTTETTPETEEKTEERTTEPPYTETEKPTEKATETKPVTEPPIEVVETEKETEPVVVLPLISLEYESHGNGTCSVIGIGNVTDSYIAIPSMSPTGEIVIAIEDKAFYQNMTVRAIEIPATVATIGELAFASCPELVYISVDKSNRLFTDVGGILYSYDMTKLIAYPSASGASSINLTASVKSISAMAFYGCKNLKTVVFEGTLAEWSKVSIGEMNYGLYTASIICSDYLDK